MGSLAAIRDGLKTRLETISGLAARSAGANINPPIALVGWPQEIEYDRTHARGTDAYVIPVKIVIGIADNESADNRLEGYLAKTGAGSIKVAVEGDRTLGGACQDCRVVRMSGAGAQEMADGVLYLVADFEIAVLA